MKKIIFFLFFISLTLYSNSQEIISSQGDSYFNSSLTFDFTIGEPIIETISENNIIFTQGFHQTKLTITNINDLNEKFNISIRPNPVKQYLEILISENDINFEIEIVDVNSKVLYNKKIYNNINLINFSKYKSGTYLVIIKDINDYAIKTIKIQKTE